MIDADTLTAAILAAGYTTEEIARIADALGASYHAIATPGATPADEARGLVEFAQRHDQLSDLATLIMDTAAGKKAVQNLLLGAARGPARMETNPDNHAMEKMFAQQQRQIERLTDRMDAQDRRIDAQDRNIETHGRTLDSHERRISNTEMIQMAGRPPRAGDWTIIILAAAIAAGMLMINIWQIAIR